MTKDQPKPTASPKHAVIACHPETDSFTMSVARAYCAAVEARGQVAILRDLYQMGFDPVLKSTERLPAEPFSPAPDVAAELDAIGGSSAFVLVYPLWFGTPPAMMKGYIERVFGAGFSHAMQMRHLHKPTHPLLGGKQLLSFSSSGSSKAWLTEQKAWVSLQTIFDGYLARAFWMDTPEHVHFGEIVEGMDPAAVHAHLLKVEMQAASLCERLDRR
jgi:NAD(P)H dehydrogenase (quinone)